MYRRGLRLIVRSLRAHPWSHLVAMIGACGFVLATVGFAWVLGWVTDEIILKAGDGEAGVDGSQLWVAAAAMISVSFAGGLSVVVRRWYLQMAALRTQRDWRRDLLHRYLDLPLRFHRSRPAGELLAHADADLETASMVLQPLAFSLSVVLLVSVALVTLLVIHPLLALIALVLFPALAVISQIYTKLVVAPSAVVQERVGEVSAVAHESFDGAVVVKTLGREAQEVQRLADASELLRAERIRVGRMRSTFEPLIDALPTVATVVLVLVGAWLVDSESVSAGEIVLAATLFSVLAIPLRIVGYFLEMLPRSVVSLDRVNAVMDLEVPAESTGAAGLPDGPLSLAVADLVVSHGTHRVLDGVTLDAKAGETIALVGSTGSGKSTFFEAIAGLIDYESGSIAVGGVPLEQIDTEQLRDSVALVFQESFLFADTIAENIALTGSGGAHVAAAVEAAAADDFVEQLSDGYETVVGERGVTLSGGQRQRIALARALLRSPRLLLLDDATSAVDPVVEGRILDNLREGLKATTLVVAHRLSTIELADRVAFLADGRIAAVGTHSELLELEDYRSLVRAYEQVAA